MLETWTSVGQWPNALTRKDRDCIINLRAKEEMEKRSTQEIERLCRTPYFSKFMNESRQGAIDKSHLNDIVHTVTIKASLVSSMVFSVGVRRKTN